MSEEIVPTQILQAPSVAPAPQTWTSFDDMMNDLEAWGEDPLYAQLYQGAHVVAFGDGRMALRFEDYVPHDVVSKLDSVLKKNMNVPWVVEVSSEIGDPTPAEKAASIRAQKLEEIAEIPLVRCALDAFPGAQIINVEER